MAYSDSLSDSAPTYSPSACSYGEYVHSPYIAPKEEELKYPRYSCAQSCSEMKCDHTPHEVMQRQSTSIPSLNQNMYPESSTNSSHSRSYVPNHNIPSIPNYYKPSQVPRFDYDPGYYTANAQHLLVPYSYPNYTYTNQVTQSDLSQLPVDYINYNYYDQYQYKQ